MKKVSIFTMMLLCVCLSSQAQIKFGLRAGMNVNKFSLSSDLIDASNMVGFQVGPVVEIGLLGIGAEAGVLYNMKGSKIKDVLDKDSETYRNSYIDIPINLKYTFSILGIGAYAAAGPYFSFSLDGKNLLDFVDEVGNAKDGDVSGFDIGLNFGLGVKVQKIGVGVQYGLGLKDVYDIPKNVWDEEILGKAPSAKNRAISVLLTYYF